MNPHIQNTEFGSITVDDEELDHDIVIRLSGKVKKRKKKLSKEAVRHFAHRFLGRGRAYLR